MFRGKPTGAGQTSIRHRSGRIPSLAVSDSDRNLLLAFRHEADLCQQTPLAGMKALRSGTLL
ncbi:hypothetical protein ACFV2N_43065 [Streptomyces sp. NPDC059680]|uniref:hypothetical protein n=1 Tax=Streptomyces sp. NPDC059680 TaxID=3346904 RepID=UPI0036C225B9